MFYWSCILIFLEMKEEKKTERTKRKLVKNLHIGEQSGLSYLFRIVEKKTERTKRKLVKNLHIGEQSGLSYLFRIVFRIPYINMK